MFGTIGLVRDSKDIHKLLARQRKQSCGRPQDVTKTPIVNPNKLLQGPVVKH